MARGVYAPCGPAHPSRRALRAAGGLRDLEALRAVFVAREGRLLGALAAKMAGAKGGEAVFEVWMKRESDLVQVGSGWRPWGEGREHRE